MSSGFETIRILAGTKIIELKSIRLKKNIYCQFTSKDISKIKLN